MYLRERGTENVTYLYRTEYILVISNPPDADFSAGENVDRDHIEREIF